ncbi:hypothetical protein V8C35DRAFT_305244 [Trichoderma chlorosporum]
MDPGDGDEPNKQASGLSREEAEELYEAALKLSPEEREHLLHLHRLQNLGPLLRLALTRPEFITTVLEDSMSKEKVYDYVTDLDTRRAFFRRLMKIIKDHKLPLQLNATVFAIFMVAPLESLESRLASLERDLQTNKKDEVQDFIDQCENISPISIYAFIGKGGRPPGTKTVSEDNSPASSAPASPAKRPRHSHERAASDTNVAQLPMTPIRPANQQPTTPRQISAGNTHFRTPSLASSQGSGRSIAAADRCKLRDGQACVITGTSHPEAAHIFPFAGSKGDRTFNILSTLRMFWDDKTVSRVSTLIQDRNITESPSNLISLNRQVHYWFDKGFMALKPLRKHNDGTVDVQLHWLKGSLLRPKQPLSKTDDIQTWIISAGIANQCWGDVTANRKSGLPLETGQTFNLGPGTRPTAAAPDFDLLKLSWDLLRVAAISGAAEFVELLIVDSDDDDENDCFEIQTQEEIYRESDYTQLYQWQREFEQGLTQEREAGEGENPDDNGKSPL